MTSTYSEPVVNPADLVDVQRIVNEYGRRKIQRSPMIEACRRVAAAYNNEIALPLPEVAGKEAPSVANLISSGIDQHAQRIADVLPDVQCPPVKPGQTRSMEKAATRRRACYGYLDQNEYELRMRKRARWLISYTNSPVWVRPDRKIGGPNLDLRSPLNTYPCDSDSMLPDDVILGYTTDVAWVRRNYPTLPLHAVRQTSTEYGGTSGLSPSDPIELVQWLDATKTVTLVTGVGYCDPGLMTREAEYGINGARIINLTPSAPGGTGMWAAVVDYAANLTGLPQVVVPSRISLEMPRSQFIDSIGLFEMQAKLAAMEFNAIANSIWPDQWLIPSQIGDTPQIVTHANGRAGRIGQISGGQLVTVQMQPGVQTPQAIDRLERAIRLSAQVPADFSGESPSNIRTARRGSAVLGEAVDYTLAEHQQILARSIQHELELCAAVDVAYYGNQQKSFYVKWKGATGRVDYKPTDIWNDDRTIHVSYAKAGADSEQLTVETGQLVGMGVMSKDTAMRRLPDIEDPEKERSLIIGESLDAALLASLQQQANAGTLPAVDLARIKQRVVTEDLEAAVVEQQKEAQQRQAAQVDATAPEAQPGLAAAGTGAEQPTAIPPPTPDVQNLAQLIRNVRTPAVAAGGG